VPESTTTVRVAGMTCSHCVGAVTEELSKVPGVVDVRVDLVEGGTSPVQVTHSEPLDDAAVAAAVDEAGYELVR
jgi:copper chaperone